MNQKTANQREPSDRNEQAKGQAQERDDRSARNRKGETDRRLDEGLEETFPSSDPVSVKITK